MTAQTKGAQASLTPQQALRLLAEGNQRLQANQRKDRDLLGQVKATPGGSSPSR